MAKNELNEKNNEKMMKDEIRAMNELDIQAEFSNLNLVDMDDLLKLLNRTFSKCEKVDMSITTENLNGNRNSFLRKLTDKIEQSQEEILVAKKDVKQISGTDKTGRDSRKAITWVKTLEARYYKLFEKISNSAFNRINNISEADISSYKSYINEEVQEQIALLKSDIESLEAEAKILKHNNNTLRFSNRNTSVIQDKEEIIERSRESLSRLSAIENSGGEIDKVNAEIAQLEEKLNITNNKSITEIKSEMLDLLEEINLRLLLSFVANFGITDDIGVVKDIASNVGKAYDLEDLAKNYYVTYLDQQDYEGVLSTDITHPLCLVNMVNEINGYNPKHKTIDSLQTVGEIEWAIEASKAALESARQGFSAEFTKEKLAKLIEATNSPDDYFTTEINFNFLNLHNDKFKSTDLVNLESCINVFNKKIKRTVKNNETRIQIKRLDSRIYDGHKNLYSDIIFWYQQAIIPINSLFGTSYEFDFTDLKQVEKVISDLNEEFIKADKDVLSIANALNTTKTTMRNALKGFEEAIERSLNDSKTILGNLFEVKAFNPEQPQEVEQKESEEIITFAENTSEALFENDTQETL